MAWFDRVPQPAETPRHPPTEGDRDGAVSGRVRDERSDGEWEPDPEVPGSVMHELVQADGLHAGLTRFTDVDGPVPWTPQQREVAMILEGSVRIELADGGTLELGVGDLFSLPPGRETTWHITTPFKEMWVLATS